ncbi:glycosyltransferase family 4 protein [Dyella amyloliquefaciens]|uniref:glycosyltransferase family 4 protein n=1 Tax=Dyella amyloliquefaciens TaxID=1770545 RepID=UPI0013EEC935|nr:glycosyltransferase family 4 protein [Dyella amyloliquefaciens]
MATVVPMHLEVLGAMGAVEFIPTHDGGPLGKFWPWLKAFPRVIGAKRRHRDARCVFHLHPGSGFCLIRMLILAAIVRYGLRRPVLVYLHTPYLDRYLNGWYWRGVLSGLVKCADRVIVLTSYALGLLEAHGLADTTRVVPNPYSPSDARKERQLSRDGGVTVLAMGRLVEGKGFMETLYAMPHLPENYRLIIAGEGELNEAIGEAIDSLGLRRRVLMSGWVEGDKKEELLLSADVFCLPSRVDSFGMSFIEAQVYDVPIVAYAHEPVIEVIREHGGVFVDSLNPKAIAMAIKKANDLNSEMRPGSGKKWVCDSFGIERTRHRLSSVIKEVA